LRPLLHLAGSAPADRVYEEESAVAIMDAHPAATGHVLVDPKRHSPDLWHIEPEEAEKATAASVQVDRMIGRALGPDGINLVHAGGRAAWQSVFHFDRHLVARHERDGFGAILAA
jgi:histidine triad (HIT) family protein